MGIKTKRFPFPSVGAPPTVYFGRIVRMDDRPNIDDGAMYVSFGSIRAVQARSDPPPAGFDGATRVETGGTIFPGLIELHTHRAFNVLSMAVADQKYSNRDQWRPCRATNWMGNPWHYSLAVMPMSRLMGYDQVVSTYVDTKAVVAGTTTTQGIPVVDSYGFVSQRPSLLRSVEDGKDPENLPDAYSRIDDLDSDPGPNKQQEKAWTFTDVSNKLESLKGGALLLHLCEGYIL